MLLARQERILAIDGVYIHVCWTICSGFLLLIANYPRSCRPRTRPWRSCSTAGRRPHITSRVLPIASNPLRRRLYSRLFSIAEPGTSGMILRQQVHELLVCIFLPGSFETCELKHGSSGNRCRRSRVWKLPWNALGLSISRGAVDMLVNSTAICLLLSLHRHTHFMFIDYPKEIHAVPGFFRQQRIY